MKNSIRRCRTWLSPENGWLQKGQSCSSSFRVDLQKLTLWSKDQGEWLATKNYHIKVSINSIRTSVALTWKSENHFHNSGTACRPESIKQSVMKEAAKEVGAQHTYMNTYMYTKPARFHTTIFKKKEINVTKKVEEASLCHLKHIPPCPPEESSHTDNRY